MALEQASYRISIHAPAQRVWDILWGETTYPQWTAPFDPASNVHTDWQVGSRVIFGSSTGSGMIALIHEKREPEYLAFKHLGQIKDGVEDLDSPEVQAWRGAIEAYELHSTAPNITELTVTMDTAAEYKDYFAETFPKALEEVKRLAEASA